MKKSIYLNFRCVPAEHIENNTEQSYVVLFFEKVCLYIFDVRSIKFIDTLCASFGVEPDSWTLYIPQRGDGFSFHAVDDHDMVPLLENNQKAVHSLFLTMEATVYIDEVMPDIVRFILHLMSDKQIRDNFPKLYPLYHGFRSSHFTR